MRIKQNKLATYLAVTAGVGCASSVAEGAIQVVDLSGLSTSSGNSALPPSTGDNAFDFTRGSSSGAGYLSYNQGYFYGDQAGVNGEAMGYTAGPAAFPSTRRPAVSWVYHEVTAGSGMSVGMNWVAFKDSADNYGWMSFTLSSLGFNSTDPISAFGSFVYDDTSTSPANAISLETAIAAVPEPSSLALLALGSIGLAARRQRRKTA